MGDTVLAIVLAQEEDSGNDLISVVPGLMIWTLITFAIVFFVLRKLAFSRIQGMIDARRARISEALDEADRAREEARQLIDEHRQLISQAKSQSEEILSEARRVGDAQRDRLRGELEEERQRRLEDTRRQVEAETRRALEQLRTEVAELTVIATARVAGKVLDDKDHRRLIDEAINELDFSVLEGRDN